MDEDRKRELITDLKNKRRRKFLLLALAVIIVVSTVLGLSIEKKDAKLPDGQGNVVAEQMEEIPGSEPEEQSEVDSEEPPQPEEVPEGEATQEPTEQPKMEQDKNSDREKDTNNSKKPTENRKPSKQDLAQMTDEEKENIRPSDVIIDNSEDYTASNDGNEVLKPDDAKPVTVTVEIRCDTLSSDMTKLENPAIESYIPTDGTILAKTTYKGTTDNTVFDALNTVCRNNDIQLDFEYTPIFESNYIKGINYLYEFDGGKLSGWMYKVNDWFPNYGCSSYYLSDGDEIQWVYSCDLGNDVGDNSMQ